MPWTRLSGGIPPDEQTMNYWEKQGFSQITVMGPCPTVDPRTGQPKGSVYVVYLWRSIVAPGRAQVGWPQFNKGPQDATPITVPDQPVEGAAAPSAPSGPIPLVRGPTDGSGTH